MNKITIDDSVFADEIKSTHIFTEMSDQDLRSLLQCSFMYSYAKDEVVISEGQVHNTLAILVSGKVEIVKKNALNEVRIAILHAPSFFGESSLFNNEPATATVRCLESSTIIIFTREQFSKFLKSNVRGANIFLMHMVFGLLKKLNATNNELIEEKNLKFSPEDLRILSSILNP